MKFDLTSLVPFLLFHIIQGDYFLGFLKEIVKKCAFYLIFYTLRPMS